MTQRLSTRSAAAASSEGGAYHNNNNTATTADLQEADQSLLLVFPELRESLARINNGHRGASTSSGQTSLLSTTSRPVNNNTMQEQEQQQHVYAGVLWKRRDVFKNRWRPRWFSLHPQQGILTYYLLSTHGSTVSVTMDDTVGSFAGTGPARRNLMDGSNMSGVSDNSMDYDVVPRGTIFLWGSSTTGASGGGGASSVAVVSNDLLSKPSEHLYAFSIRSTTANDVVVVHLAARTAAARAAWVTHLSAVCQQHTTAAVRRPLRRYQSSPMGQRPGLQRESSTSIPEQRAVENGSATAKQEEKPPVWDTVGGTATVTATLPDGIVEELNAKLEEYLPLCEPPPSSSTKNGDGWKLMFQRDDDYSAFQRTTDAGRIVVQTHRTLPYSPMHVLAVLADIAQRRAYETNLQTNERIQILNPHTWFDVYAYRGVWPTSAREFSVVSHWRVVTTTSSLNNTSETAIVYVSFSCPASDAARPVTPKCVRGQVIVSLYLLRAADTSTSCRLTRLLAVDLGGGLSAQLSNIVASQSAGLPAVLDEYMGKNDTTSHIADSVRTTALPTNERILEDIIPQVGNVTKTEEAKDADPSANDEGEETGGAQTAGAPSVVIAPEDDKYIEDSNASAAAAAGWEWQAMYLLAPVVLARCCSLLVGHGLLFCVLSFLSLRQMVLLGNSHGKKLISGSTGAGVVETVTCRFTVEPKGIVRFVANHQEEREEIDATVTEVKAVHVVVSALAKALHQRKELRRRRLYIPWLWVDRVVDISDDPIAISVLQNGNGSKSMETICGPEKLKVRGVADRMKASTTCGECLILPIENEQPAAPPVRLDASSIHPNVAIVACVFGLPAPAADKMNNGLPFLKGSSPARQQISVALTIRGGVFDPFACPALAQEVQKLLQFPEMCDDD